MLDLSNGLVQRLLVWADTELILAHRDSEWTGFAPILEEDIAFANIAQDELGHAWLWYRYIEELTGIAPDQLVFFRDAAAYRCARLVEYPNGDWAFSMLRQYLLDQAEGAWLAGLQTSADDSIAAIAGQIAPEEQYHRQHTTLWVRRLGLGSEESNGRMQAALDSQWPLTAQLFAPVSNEAELVAQRIVPKAEGVHKAWSEAVRPFLAAADLVVPEAPTGDPPGFDRHTEYLPSLLAEMQSVARLDPEANW